MRLPSKTAASSDVRCRCASNAWRFGLMNSLGFVSQVNPCIATDILGVLANAHGATCERVYTTNIHRCPCTPRKAGMLLLNYNWSKNQGRLASWFHVWVEYRAQCLAWQRVSHYYVTSI